MAKGKFHQRTLKHDELISEIAVALFVKGYAFRGASTGRKWGTLSEGRKEIYRGIARAALYGIVGTGEWSVRYTSPFIVTLVCTKKHSREKAAEYIDMLPAKTSADEEE